MEKKYLPQMKYRSQQTFRVVDDDSDDKIMVIGIDQNNGICIGELLKDDKIINVRGMNAKRGNMTKTYSFEKTIKGRLHKFVNGNEFNWILGIIIFLGLLIKVSVMISILNNNIFFDMLWDSVPIIMLFLRNTIKPDYVHYVLDGGDITKRKTKDDFQYSYEVNV